MIVLDSAVTGLGRVGAEQRQGGNYTIDPRRRSLSVTGRATVGPVDADQAYVTGRAVTTITGFTLNVEAELKNILGEILSLGDRAARFNDQTPLLGSLPELDSMAVVSVITTIEERFGVVVGDDEISAQTFATFGTLREFIEQKLAD